MSSSLKFVGNLINLQDVGIKDLKHLLRIGLREKRRRYFCKKKVLKGKVVNMVMEEQCLINQFASQTAVKQLGAICNLASKPDISKGFEDSYFNLSRILQSQADIVLTSTTFHGDLESLVKKSKGTIISILSCYQCPALAISTLMTLKERHGKLNGLTAALIGTPYPYLNSLLLVMPRLGINIRQMTSCKDGRQKSYRYFLEAKDLIKDSKSELKECTNLQDALQRANVAIIGQDVWSGFQINEKDISKYCSGPWSIMYDPVRSAQLNSDMLTHHNMLTFQVIENLKWTYIAIILKCLSYDDRKIGKLISNI